MTGMVAASSTLTNGPSVMKEMVGPNGVINGMRTSMQTAMALSRGRHGGKGSMESGGIAHGASAIMALDGCTSTGRAAAGSTGIHTWRKKHGTRDFHITVSITVLRTQFSSGKFRLRHNF